jgi:CxxC motif-containing protein (DUF1111 family)
MMNDGNSWTRRAAGSALAIALALTAASCGDGSGGTPPIAQGIFATMGQPRPSATPEQLATFERGRAVATRRFVDSDGLGPDYNVQSCTSCHERPVTGGAGAHYRDFLLVRQVLNDGSSLNTGVNGVQPQFTLDPVSRRPTDPGTNLEANRNPIPFFGVGLLAEIPDSEILSRVDEDDADGDGISGRANYDRGFVGRFGLKAQTVSIEGFIRGPLFNHLGITTDPLPDDLKAALPVPSAPIGAFSSLGFRDVFALLSEQLVAVAHAQVAAPETPTVDFDGVPDPELSIDDLFDLVSFAMLLAAPQPDPPTEQTMAGSDLFGEIGCTGCHVRALRGPRGGIPAYTDLLIHDMGSELADGITMGVASGTEFRTQPLWGVTAEAPYLHDGRADTLDEAIRAHGGEATNARNNYEALTNAERADILAFLDSLGGSSQRSEGLLPPGTPLIPVGQIGGPDRVLSPSEEAEFARGREIFDRDFGRNEGLGPLFNGDSCRACHFDPVIGGSGPDDVDVMREGNLQDGVFTAPPDGTIAHHFSTDGVRPAIDPDSNVFEARQPPPIFGLGFLDSIPEADVLANDNCGDPDLTAISGCARFTDDGRLGRLGWKANVPSVAEFSRDGLTNECGVTVPDIPGQTFGALTDSDAIPDPEISEQDLDALTFYMQHLAPPPGHSTDPAAEAAGKVVFDAIGCTGCHVPDFVTPTGVVAYTDLLLHQVAPDGSPGIGDGPALPLEIRTAPLWGLSLTAPYMHDGRSFTITSAIERHDAEAAAARDAYEALSDQEKAELLAFLRSL